MGTAFGLMKTLLSILACVALSMSSFGQTQGVSQRATNGVAFGDTIVQTHIRATNTTSTNTFSGKFQQGSSTASGTGASAFGLGTVSSASYAFGAGIRNQNAGSGALVTGLSNTVFSGGSGSIVSGNNNSASGPYELISGANNVVDGSNTFVAGFGIAMDTLAHNGFFAGQNISVLSGASNNFAWNGDPASPLVIPDTRTNAFTVQAPGGIFLNGVQFTNGGGSSGSGVTGMKTNQFTTNTVGSPIVGNVNLGGATNNASGDFGVNGTLGTGTANAGTLAVSGNASVNGTLSSSTSTSGVHTVTGSIIATITNQYPYFDENGVLRGTNNGAGFTNLSAGTVYASNIVSGGTIPVGALATNTASSLGNELLQVTGDKRRWNSNVVIGGSLGVGIAATAKLTVAGNIDFSTGAAIQQNTSDGADNQYVQISGGGVVSESRGASIQMFGNEFPNYAGTLILQAGSVTPAGTYDGKIRINTGNADRMTILATNGNIGIGTQVPLNKLDVAGALVVGGTAAGSITAPANGLYVQGVLQTPSAIQSTNTLTANTALTINGAASGAAGIVFRYITNNVDKITIDNAGTIVTVGNIAASVITSSEERSLVFRGQSPSGPVTIGTSTATNITILATNVFVSGSIVTTNGIGSYSSITPVVIAATGWTNIWSTNNAVVVFDGTTCFYTNYLRSGVAWYTNVAALAHDRVSLQPGEGIAINGTGVTGVAKPF